MPFNVRPENWTPQFEIFRVKNASFDLITAVWETFEITPGDLEKHFEQQISSLNISWQISQETTLKWI